MRALAEPEVLRRAALAAIVSALACFPRLQAWETRIYPIWYLETVLFLGAIVLWGFVFAWHTKYSGGPVFTFRPHRVAFIAATVAGGAGAVLQFVYFDPVLKARTPEDFPQNISHWLSIVLFSLAFADLFIVFAPFDWLLRLVRSRKAAAGLTIVFGLFVLWLKQRAIKEHLPNSFLALLLCSRAAAGMLSVYFYLRGGVLLVWWCHLLVQARHFWQFHL
jgi:hypothetical protein